MVNSLNENMIEACKKDDVVALMKLIKAGADVNFRDERGDTVLMFASYKGYVGLVKALIEAGADIGIEGHLSITAPGFAKIFGHKDVVEILENRKNRSSLVEKIISLFK